MERHYTDHDSSDIHSNPHDHEIDWDNGYPHLGPPISNFENGATKFESFRKVSEMCNKILKNQELNQFETISDFKWCMRQGGEIEFEWKNKVYFINRPNEKINIHEEGRHLEAKEYETADEALEYMVGEDRLGDVITKVKVWSRTI